MDISNKLGELQARVNSLEKRLQTLETQDKVGNFTAGSILFAGSTGALTQDNANLFWDDTNSRLGIGTTTPSAFMHIKFAGSSKTFFQVEDTAASTDVLIKLIGSSITSGSYFIRAVDGSNADQFYVRGDGLVYAGNSVLADGGAILRVTDSGTNNVVVSAAVNHETSGTPAAGFGSSIFFNIHSSTNTLRNAGDVRSLWATATDATRKGRMTLQVYDTAAREWIRGEASGSAPMIGFLGTAASAKLTVTGSRAGNAALASLLTQLATYGLITDSSTA